MTNLKGNSKNTKSSIWYDHNESEQFIHSPTWQGNRCDKHDKHDEKHSNATHQTFAAKTDCLR